MSVQFKFPDVEAYWMSRSRTQIAVAVAIAAAMLLGVLAVGDKRPPQPSATENLAFAYVYDGVCARVPGLIAMMQDDPRASRSANSPAFQRSRDKAIEQYAASPRGFCLAMKPGIDRIVGN